MRHKLLPLLASTSPDPAGQERVMRAFWTGSCGKEEARVIALESERPARTPRR